MRLLQLSIVTVIVSFLVITAGTATASNDVYLDCSKVASAISKPDTLANVPLLMTESAGGLIFTPTWEFVLDIDNKSAKHPLGHQMVLEVYDVAYVFFQKPPTQQPGGPYSIERNSIDRRTGVWTRQENTYDKNNKLVTTIVYLGMCGLKGTSKF